MNNNKIRKTALITGATKGIGYELTKLFARDYYDLVLVARNKDKLIEIKKDLSNKYDIDILIIAKDLSVPNAALEIFRETIGKQIIIDVLVNNAGIGDFEIFNNAELSKISQIMQINIVSLTELTKFYLKGMVYRKEGKILNVSSMAAFQPGPYMAVYYASKAYVQSFSEAIASELKGTGVTVTALCPGPTKSGFQHEVGSEGSNLSKLNLLSSSEYVAKYGYRALHEGKRVAIPGFVNTSLVNTAKFIPRKTTIQVVKKLQELNRKEIFSNN
ncbi:MAG: SDR family oxidoreductase [Bacteroidetes bacterium]|nr:SDR family oxidoreductase [Bacteroidota bacterium]